MKSQHSTGWSTKPQQQPKNDIAGLFKRLSRIYGISFTRRFNNDVAGAIQEWQDCLRSFSQEIINRACDIVRDYHKFSPTPSEFRKLCEDLKPQALGREGKGLSMGGECLMTNCNQEAECAFVRDGQRYWICWSHAHPTNCECGDIICEANRKRYVSVN